MEGEAAEALRRRDEILQVMFWMRGEGLGEEVSASDLERFLDESAATALPADLEAMAGAGLVEPAGGGRYRLTPVGREEGGRRFLDEFGDYMRPGHGACSDPSCDCHVEGPDACVAAR